MERKGIKRVVISMKNGGCMADIVMFGTGQFAEVAVAYLERDTTHNIVAFALDRDFIEEPTFQGKPVVAFEDLEQHYPPDQIELFIPLSYKKMNRYREQHYLDAKQRGYRFITYISPHARIHSHTKIGENCMILDDNVIQPYVEIGNNCILWSGNHIGHHTKIRDNVFIASHAVVSGAVEIGNNCFLGVNCTIRDNITIAPFCLIGAGAVILDSTSEKQLFIGPKSVAAKISTDDLKKI
jgi:sugar O-acyltransferase (sialic acid O-acetyltransferase NeuD family)